MRRWVSVFVVSVTGTVALVGGFPLEAGSSDRWGGLSGAGVAAPEHLSASNPAEKLASLEDELKVISQQLTDLNAQLRAELPLLPSLWKKVTEAEAEVAKGSTELLGALSRLASSPSDPALKAEVDRLRNELTTVERNLSAARNEYNTQQSKVYTVQAEVERLQLRVQSLLSEIQLEISRLPSASTSA